MGLERIVGRRQHKTLVLLDLGDTALGMASSFDSSLRSYAPVPSQYDEIDELKASWLADGHKEQDGEDVSDGLIELLMERKLGRKHARHTQSARIHRPAWNGSVLTEPSKFKQYKINERFQSPTQLKLQGEFYKNQRQSPPIVDLQASTDSRVVWNAWAANSRKQRIENKKKALLQQLRTEMLANGRSAFGSGTHQRWQGHDSGQFDRMRNAVVRKLATDLNMPASASRSSGRSRSVEPAKRERRGPGHEQGGAGPRRQSIQPPSTAIRANLGREPSPASTSQLGESTASRLAQTPTHPSNGGQSQRKTPPYSTGQGWPQDHSSDSARYSHAQTDLWMSDLDTDARLGYDSWLDAKMAERRAAAFHGPPPGSMLGPSYYEHGTGPLTCDQPGVSHGPGGSMYDHPMVSHGLGGSMYDQPAVSHGPGGSVYDHPMVSHGPGGSMYDQRTAPFSQSRWTMPAEEPSRWTVSVDAPPYAAAGPPPHSTVRSQEPLSQQWYPTQDTGGDDDHTHRSDRDRLYRLRNAVNERVQDMRVRDEAAEARRAAELHDLGLW